MILCAIYAISKVLGKDIKFKQIVNSYKSLPFASTHVSIPKSTNIYWEKLMLEKLLVYWVFHINFCSPWDLSVTKSNGADIENWTHRTMKTFLHQFLCSQKRGIGCVVWIISNEKFQNLGAWEILIQSWFKVTMEITVCWGKGD